MTRVNMVHDEFNEIIYIYIYIWFTIIIIKIINIQTNINNVTTFFSRKISHKMTMPHKLVWMDEKFM
jgi:hypothetical protein